MTFEVFMAARMMLFLDYGPEDGVNMFLRNGGIYLRVYTVLKPRKIIRNLICNLLKILI